MFSGQPGPVGLFHVVLHVLGRTIGWDEDDLNIGIIGNLLQKTNVNNDKQFKLDCHEMPTFVKRRSY